jgi:hypothetical protein
MADQVFEMLWDCEFCATRGLLGLTNRFCPSCGAPQNPAKRYFPKPGEEKAATNLEFDGADKVCPACATPCGAKANNCRNCGSPLDGSKEVTRVADRVPGQPAALAGKPPPPAPKPSSRPWLWLVVGALGLSIAFCLVAALWKKTDTATVTGHRWERSIDVEVFGPVSESAWCDALPAQARNVTRSREQRGSNKVQDGEDCTSRDVDRGNGTFVRKRECTPRYKSEPIYDDKCRFQVDKWSTTRALERKGEGLSPAPAWPDVSGLRTGACVGCEREGGRRESYTLFLKLHDGAQKDCTLPAARWQQLEDGKQVTAQVGVVTGSVDCESLKP